MLYNPQFALADEGWEAQGVSFGEQDGSMVCRITPAGSLRQTIPDIRDHFSTDKYFCEFDVVSLTAPGTVEIQVGDTVLQAEITHTGKIQLTLDHPVHFGFEISSIDADLAIDNLKLYSQIQRGYLYDENFEELECIDEIRTLNGMLTESE